MGPHSIGRLGIEQEHAFPERLTNYKAWRAFVRDEAEVPVSSIFDLLAPGKAWPSDFLDPDRPLLPLTATYKMAA